MGDNMLKGFMLELGYTEQEIYKIIEKEPLSSCSNTTLIKYINNIFNFFLSMGVSRKEIIRITTTYPVIISYNVDTISNKMFSMIILGYTQREVKKIFLTYPMICGISVDTIKEKINDMINLGYTYEDVIRMTVKYPNMYGLSKDNIKQKIEGIVNLGYTYEEVLSMTKNHPALFGYTLENIREKCNFYESIGLKEVTIKEPARLMQSVELSYARYMFYASIGKNISIKNYSVLFVNQKQFVKYYKKNNSELMEEYKYSEYKENKKKLVISK